MSPDKIASNFYYITPEEKIEALLGDGTKVFVSDLGGRVEFFGEDGELMQGNGIQYHFPAGTFIDNE